MHGVPGFRTHGGKIFSRGQREKLKNAEVVCRRVSGRHHTGHAVHALFHVELDFRTPHRLAGFVQHLSGEYRRRHQPQHQVLRFKLLAGYNRGPELLMLLVTRGEITAPASLQRILARSQSTESEPPVFACQQGRHIPGIVRVG